MLGPQERMVCSGLHGNTRARSKRRRTLLFWLLCLVYVASVVSFAYHWCYSKPYWMRLEMDEWPRDSGESFFWSTSTRVMPRLLMLMFGLTAPCFCCLLYACAHFITPDRWLGTD